MSELPEVNSLFAALASKLQEGEATAEDDDRNLDNAVRNFNMWLNLSETNPKVQVLDTALSLMCFTAPQVFNSMIEFMVRTIVTVLSSSVECEVVKWGNEESIQVCRSIFGLDCVGTVETCSDIFQKLEASRGDLSPLLLYAVVRAAALAPKCHYSEKMIKVKARGRCNPAFAKLLCHSSRDCILKSGEIPLRLLRWMLDPMLLKNDICQILLEITSRPFLFLEKEFYEKTDWISILTCLVLSPTMFIQTRALLHNWFLLMGLAPILEFHTELVLQVLDIGCRPMRWGIPMEIATTLPCSRVYFPCENQLLRVLSGPLSLENFRHLVCEVIKLDCAVNKLISPSNQDTKISRVDLNSCWAMAINFPSWFSFASFLLFVDGCSRDNYYLKCIPWLNKPNPSSGTDLPSYSIVAARFIAWVLNPIGDSFQELIVEHLTKLSHARTLKNFYSGKGNAATGGNNKKSRRSLSDIKGNTSFSGFDYKTLWLWLKEFQDIHTRYSRKVNDHFASTEADHSQGVGCQKNVLYRKIPLGILLSYCDSISDVESELLLHYAATGTLDDLCEPRVGKKHMKHSREFTLTEKYPINEAVAGAKIVFHLTDATESISTNMFETEENRLKFLCHVKENIGKYLLKCVKRLLQLRVDDEFRHQTLSDLYLRMMRWKHQGKDIYSSYKDWDDVMGAVKCASSPPC
ncbi:unnamed protein product [Cuscuta europaea]|uniref:Uncharacterized protein n=2 Tax=Cuscuta europaea TaxID=41803 RepID=A0A9P0Z236_CUSEU|nr:unnamed protein product [Cuscuta europaea]